MISLNFIKGRLLHYLEYFKNRNSIQKSSFKYYPKTLHSWCGIDKIHLHPHFESKRPKLIKKYSQLKGELGQVKIHDERHISYDDHVSRINAQGKLLQTAMFQRPSLSDMESELINLRELGRCSDQLRTIINSNVQLHSAPKPFNYTEMEHNAQFNKPVCVGLPRECGDNYVFNQHESLTDSVLHLPIKISADKAKELTKEGRVLAHNNRLINCENIYLPKNLQYLAPLIKFACQIELECNPEFMNQYYIFLSISHSIIPPGDFQRRGGWHIDGHQGYERLQKDGKKLPCDRQYLISNVLPTEIISCPFNFDKIREYCRKNFSDLDSVNMQDVIEQQASYYESSANVSTLVPNQLNFLNPYMVHRAVPNKSDQPIRRSFARLLFSTFTRNRLGDSVNPVLGPIYPLKIKTIKDIHEISSELYLNQLCLE
jgi:hypothetical protein